MAQEFWKYLQARDRICKQFGPEALEVFDDIDIQAEVLEMDPEFSFYKDVFEEDPKPVPALLEGLKHSSTG